MMVVRLMQHGKKSTAQRILSDAFGLINERTGGDPSAVRNAVKNPPHWWKCALAGLVAPLIRCPWKCAERGTAMALRWLVSTPCRNGRASQKLAGELMDAANELATPFATRRPTKWPKPTKPSPTTATEPFRPARQHRCSWLTCESPRLFTPHPRRISCGPRPWTVEILVSLLTSMPKNHRRILFYSVVHKIGEVQTAPQ